MSDEHNTQEPKLHDVVMLLYAAYTALGGRGDADEFRQKILGGIALWDDLDLSASLKLLEKTTLFRSMNSGSFRGAEQLR